MPELVPVIRQWILLKMLGGRRLGVTLREMAEQSGCSQKTIRRDLNTLQQVGFPLTQTVSEHGCNAAVRAGTRLRQRDQVCTELFLNFRNHVGPLWRILLNEVTVDVPAVYTSRFSGLCGCRRVICIAGGGGFRGSRREQHAAFYVLLQYEHDSRPEVAA